MNNVEILRYYACVKIDRTLWVSNAMFNGLYSIDLDTDEVNYHGRFLSSKNNVMDIHSIAGVYNDVLYFIPQNGSGIDLYDLKSRKKDVCKINTLKEGKVPHTMAGAWGASDAIYMLPKFAGQCMLKYSFSEKKVVPVAEKSFEQINAMISKDQEILTVNGVFVYGKVWFAMWNSNKVFAIDYLNDSWSEYDINFEKPIETVFSDGKQIWMGAENTLLKWNFDNGIEAVIPELYQNKLNKSNLITEVLFYEKKAFVIPQNLGLVQQIDLENNRIINSFELSDDDFQKIESWRDMKTGFFEDGKLILNPAGRDKEVSIDINTGNVLYKRYSVPKASICRSKDIIYKEGDISLTQYLLNYIDNKD